MTLPSGLWLGRTIEELVAEELARKRREQLRRRARIAAPIVVVLIGVWVWVAMPHSEASVSDVVAVAVIPPVEISEAEKNRLFLEFAACFPRCGR